MSEAATLPASPPAGPDAALLSVDDLGVAFRNSGRWVEVVSSASFEIARGEVLGLVGESGSGKSVTSFAIAGLIGSLGGRVTHGTTTFDGEDLATFGDRDWRRVRGSKIAMIFQHPTRSLDPAFTVGDQIAESLRRHLGVSRREARTRAIAALDRVGIADAARRSRDYPHMFSGGMCQRAMIAMALSGEPELLIADEPTTALDVTVQARILDLLRELRDETGIAILYISHDLSVIAEICDRAAVMYAGETVEIAEVRELFRRPRHPYTAGLLRAVEPISPGQRFVTIQGQVPSPDRMPTGCHFHPRCDHALAGVCTETGIELRPVDGRAVRCARAESIDLLGSGP